MSVSHKALEPVMKRKLILLVAVALLPGAAALSQNAPRIGYVFPAGGQRGATFKVAIGGQFLGGVTNLVVSQGGVTARVADYNRPMSQKEFNDLREQIEDLKKKRDAIQASRKTGMSPAAGWTAADERAFTDIRKKLAAYQRRPPNPAIAETVTLDVSIAPDAAPGNRELRLRTVNGLSNPMTFKVGALAEVSEKPERTEEERPAKAPKRLTASQPVNPAEITVSPPVVVNGQIMAGDVDRVKFRVRQGQKLVIRASARELVPYLPDAVPGWFQATLALFDSKGREMAYEDDFRFSPDPVIFFQVPRDGEYAVEIKDSIFRGREDFVYRLEIGEMPFITSVFPMGAPADASAAVKLTGWNLPQTEVSIGPSAAGSPLHWIGLTGEKTRSNLLPFERGVLPEIMEPSSGKSDAAHTIRMPVVINGRIQAAGEVDRFMFDGKAGVEITAEIKARRLLSPLDSVLRLLGPDGGQLGLNDDFEDKSAGLTTHQADSRIQIKLPADGRYVIEVSDGQRKGGLEYAYRLRLSPPAPDFELRVAPSTITLRPGGTMPVTVYALRKDGFTGDISLELEGDDFGFVLEGGRVPAGAEKICVTLTAPASAKGGIMPLKIEGLALVAGKAVRRSAVPSEDMMQAFFYRHLVPADELLVCVRDGNAHRFPIRLAGETPVKIPCGGTANVRFFAPKFAMQRGTIELAEPPDGITISKTGEWNSGAEITLACDAAKVKPGTRGNLIFEPAPAKTPNAKGAGGKSALLGSLPAVPFIVVE